MVTSKKNNPHVLEFTKVGTFQAQKNVPVDSCSQSIGPPELPNYRDRVNKLASIFNISMERSSWPMDRSVYTCWYTQSIQLERSYRLDF